MVYGLVWYIPSYGMVWHGMAWQPTEAPNGYCNFNFEDNFVYDFYGNETVNKSVVDFV